MSNKMIKAITILALSLMVMGNFSATAFAYSNEKTQTNSIPKAAMESTVSEKTITEIKPLTPDGNATLVDDATEKNAKQFLTVVTPNKQYFYIIIDHQKGADNVYMLSPVDENDLMNFVSDHSGKADSNLKAQNIIGSNTTAITQGTAALTSDKSPVSSVKPEKTESSKQSGANIAALFFVAALALAIGVGYYFFKIRRNKNKDDIRDEDLEFYDDEDYINEDEDSHGTAKESVVRLQSENERSEEI